MTTNDIIAYVALWDPSYGVTIEDCTLSNTNIDIDTISLQLFITLNSLFYSDDEGLKNSLVTLPLISINKKAKIFLNFITEDNKNFPYIVVILLPDYFSDEKASNFDDILVEIGKEYKNSKKTQIKDYFNDIYETFVKLDGIDNSLTEIDANYSFTDALIDFKKGLEYLSTGKTDLAYIFIKKSHIRFEKDNFLGSLIETTYFLGTILVQMNKHQEALEYYEKLEMLATELNNQKYYENALFMGGVCSYLINNYTDALNKFFNLKSSEIQYINKYNFYLIFSQALKNIGSYKESIEILEFINSSDEVQLDYIKKAKILFELGNNIFNIAVQEAKLGFLNIEFKSHLQNSIKYFLQSSEIYENIEDFENVLKTEAIIGRIFEIFNEYELSLEHYSIALKKADFINDIPNKLKIFNSIVKILFLIGDYEKINQEIDSMLSKMRTFVFVDLNSISILHRQLGDSLNFLNQRKDALSEYVISLNIQRKINPPTEEYLIVLEKIIQYYKSINEEENYEYYIKEYEKVKSDIEDISNNTNINNKFQDYIKEFWIFNMDRLLLFAMESRTEINMDLFSGFLIALQQFSQEISEESIKMLKTGLDLFIFYKEQEIPIFIVGRTRNKKSIELCEKALKSIYSNFIKKYSSILDDFDGDISRFSNFMEDI